MKRFFHSQPWYVFCQQYRPSTWSWRRGEARYTAAAIHSIHMWGPRPIAPHPQPHQPCTNPHSCEKSDESVTIFRDGIMVFTRTFSPSLLYFMNTHVPYGNTHTVLMCLCTFYCRSRLRCGSHLESTALCLYSTMLLRFVVYLFCLHNTIYHTTPYHKHQAMYPIIIIHIVFCHNTF